MMTYRLVGHDNPFGRYPAPVVPIGRVGDLMVVGYPGGEGGTMQTMVSDSEFVVHSMPQKGRRSLDDFDPRTQRLFAFSPTNVVAYASRDERFFFVKLLHRNEFASGHPFLRLDLAKATRNIQIVQREVLHAGRRLEEGARGFVPTWYVKQKEDIETWSVASVGVELADTWESFVLTVVEEVGQAHESQHTALAKMRAAASAMALKVFALRDDPRAEQEFLDLRRRRPNDYFATRTANGAWRIHHLHCSSLAFSGDQKLTASPKVVAESEAEIIEWARRFGVRTTGCTRCRRPRRKPPA